MDSRRPRIPVDYSVTFTGDHVTGAGTLTNLTIAGAEIQSPVDCPRRCAARRPHPIVGCASSHCGVLGRGALEKRRPVWR